MTDKKVMRKRDWPNDVTDHVDALTLNVVADGLRTKLEELGDPRSEAHVEALTLLWVDNVATNMGNDELRAAALDGAARKLGTTSNALAIRAMRRKLGAVAG